jgi:hypothetical protein
VREEGRGRSRFPAQGNDNGIAERRKGGEGMGIFRMSTGTDGKSVIEELSQDDPILETLRTCTGCSLQVNEPSDFSDFHPAPRRRWMTMLSGQIDIQLADGTIYSFGPEDLRLWEDVTGHGHRTRFPVRSVSISMPLPD